MPMDEIKSRLEETSQTCIGAFSAWCSDKKNIEVRETLQDAIHELRKVASRLEIELAISERDEMAQKPIPIPPHRAARGKKNRDDQDDRGNSAEGKSDKPRRRPPQKKEASN